MNIKDYIEEKQKVFKQLDSAIDKTFSNDAEERKEREFDIKSKDSKLPVIDKVHFNGGFLFKETIGCDSR